MSSMKEYYNITMYEELTPAEYVAWRFYFSPNDLSWITPQRVWTELNACYHVWGSSGDEHRLFHMMNRYTDSLPSFYKVKCT